MQGYRDAHNFQLYHFQFSLGLGQVQNFLLQSKQSCTVKLMFQLGILCYVLLGGTQFFCTLDCPTIHKDQKRIFTYTLHEDKVINMPYSSVFFRFFEGVTQKAWKPPGCGPARGKKTKLQKITTSWKMLADLHCHNIEPVSFFIYKCVIMLGLKHF